MVECLFIQVTSVHGNRDFWMEVSSNTSRRVEIESYTDRNAQFKLNKNLDGLLIFPVAGLSHTVCMLLTPDISNVLWSTRSFAQFDHDK